VELVGLVGLLTKMKGVVHALRFWAKRSNPEPNRTVHNTMKLIEYMTSKQRAVVLEWTDSKNEQYKLWLLRPTTKENHFEEWIQHDESTLNLSPDTLWGLVVRISSTNNNQ
jgi:hypothetical protein